MAGLAHEYGPGNTFSKEHVDVDSDACALCVWRWGSEQLRRRLWRSMPTTAIQGADTGLYQVSGLAYHRWLMAAASGRLRCPDAVPSPKYFHSR